MPSVVTPILSFTLPKCAKSCTLGDLSSPSSLSVILHTFINHPSPLSPFLDCGHLVIFCMLPPPFDLSSTLIFLAVTTSTLMHHTAWLQSHSLLFPERKHGIALYNFTFKLTLVLVL